MPIYPQSTRSGSTTSVIEANLDYFRSGDVGRIMYEDAVNDLKLFEAAIGNDFAEAKSLREGTLLESELSSLQEASARAFFNSLIEKLKNWWAKLKGYITKAIAQVSAWVVRDGKKFVQLHRSALISKDYSNVKAKVADLRTNIKFTKLRKQIRETHGGSTLEKMQQDHNSEFDADAIYSKLLPGSNKSNFAEQIDKIFTDELKELPMGPGMVKSLMTMLETGGDAIKEMKKVQKDGDDAIKKIIDSLKKLNKQAEADANNKDKKDDEKQISYKNASSYVSELQRALSIGTKGIVRIYKRQLSAARNALAKCVGFQEAMEISSDAYFCETYAITEGKCAECDALEAMDADVDADDIDELED